MFLKIERIYLTIQKYFPFLPNSPASKIGLSEVVNKKRSEEAKNLIKDKDIKKTFEFFLIFFVELFNFIFLVTI